MRWLSLVFALLVAPAFAGTFSPPPNVSSGTFSPTVSFATPGDLSVSYTTQTGTYTQIGNTVYVSISLSFTATYTTASGVLRISGAPVPSSAAPAGLIPVQNFYGTTAITWPNGGTQLLASTAPNQSFMTVAGSKSATTTAATQATVAHVVSGNAVTITIAGAYSL